MSNDKIFQMDFGKVYGLLLNKAVRKGRTKGEVDQIISWLTGYSEEEIETCRSARIPYGDFFRKAPQPNPAKSMIKGVVCGVRVEEIEDPLMKDIRYLDKLIDELAKGRPMEKILRTQGEASAWVCPKCGRSFKNVNQNHYCGKAPISIEEYILSQPEEIQPSTERRHREQPARGEGKNLLGYANLLEGSQPDPVCSRQETHWPVPWSRGRRGVF